MSGAHLLVAALLCACGPAPHSAVTPVEATVVLLGQTTQLDPETNQLVTVELPICHGVAVGQFRLLTAAHCLRGTGAVFADLSAWEHTASGSATAHLESALGDLAVLRTDAPLSAWVDTAAPVDGPAELAHLAGTHVVETPAVLAGDRIDAQLAHGDSGAGVFQGGLLVGLVTDCDSTDGQTCLPSGGLFERADGGTQ